MRGYPFSAPAESAVHPPPRPRAPQTRYEVFFLNVSLGTSVLALRAAAPSAVRSCIRCVLSCSAWHSPNKKRPEPLAQGELMQSPWYHLNLDGERPHSIPVTAGVRCTLLTFQGRAWKPPSPRLSKGSHQTALSLKLRHGNTPLPHSF